MKKQWKPWLYIAAVLCMSVSCKKEECICADCGAPDQKMTYRKTIQNARADVWGSGLLIENVAGAPFFCYQQQLLYEGKLQNTYVDGQPQPFKYRVWGDIYNCDSCPTAVIGDVLHIRIDRIEMAN
ncbi:MAG: hypothetical protein EAZ32_18775 [Cytophagia bacterium]|nr:MAG: hypothetical protein EAZ38_01475 [Cytophagales bacterium]TAG35114.1 MAG: hypothetical protein EAZ32_18775 [Cytophagia bacterium]TAG51010.1 MAG: hypothetical protein EAZ29_11005 [Runella slithyformis]TAG77026.1 MAG: hypothetical protein EAZ22_16555 [Cytophagales bacterium]